MKHFTPTQWTALIDHAVLSKERIQFFFRDGHTIIVDR